VASAFAAPSSGVTRMVAGASPWRGSNVPVAGVTVRVRATSAPSIILATFAEFEVDLIRMRTREGMAVARANGKLKGRQPKLTPTQQRELKRMHQSGEYTISDLGELFSVSRPTVYRTISRTNP